MRVLLLLTLAGALGCGRASVFSEGSHYGKGIPRTAFQMGRPPQTAGQSTGQFMALEYTDYRPKAPHEWPPTSGSRLPLTWSQYRGSPSKR